MIEYAIENYDQVVADIQPLISHHWEETATYKDIPLSPNYEFYKQASQRDLIRFYTARREGFLVGYAAIVVNKRHSQYDHPWATSNLFWIKPDYRHLGVGRGLVRFLKQNLVGYVLQVLWSDDHPELGMLLESEGLALVEHVNSIRL